MIKNKFLAITLLCLQIPAFCAVPRQFTEEQIAQTISKPISNDEIEGKIKAWTKQAIKEANKDFNPSTEDKFDLEVLHANYIKASVQAARAYTALEACRKELNDLKKKGDNKSSKEGCASAAAAAPAKCHAPAGGIEFEQEPAE